MNRFKELIFSQEVLHNDKLNIDFVVLEVRVSECLEKSSKEVEVVIDILDDTDKELLKQIGTLQERVIR